MSDTLKALSTPKVYGASPLAQAAPRRALLGLFDRKERWSLSWRGRLILVSALLLGGILVFNSVYPFLAITHRVNAKVLVVEGWMANTQFERRLENPKAIIMSGFLRRAGRSREPGDTSMTSIPSLV